MTVDVHERVFPDNPRCRKQHYDNPMNMHRFLNSIFDSNQSDPLEAKIRINHVGEHVFLLRDFVGGHLIFRIYFTAISMISVFSIRRSF